MGHCFWVLVWDGWGCGLDMIAPRLHECYDEERVHRFNSFLYDGSEEDLARQVAKLEIQELYGGFFKVIV